jgi:hypothetical protein
MSFPHHTRVRTFTVYGMAIDPELLPVEDENDLVRRTLYLLVGFVHQAFGLVELPMEHTWQDAYDGKRSTLPNDLEHTLISGSSPALSRRSP